VTGPRRICLFLDSNVLTGGIVSPWGLDKATLSLCAAKVCRLVLAEAAHFRQCHHAVNILMLWASAMEHG